MSLQIRNPGLKAAAAALAAAAVILLSAGCRKGEKKAGGLLDSEPVQFLKSKLKNGPVLRVEGREYRDTDFVAYVENLQGEGVERLSPETLSRLFDRFIDEKILLEAARRRNITLDPEEKRRFLEKSGRLSEEDKAGPGGVPEDFFDELIVQKYINDIASGLTVEGPEITAYYDSHKKDFLLPERFQVSQILVPTEERAVQVLRRLQGAGEDVFRKVAAEESSGPEASRGGLMGVFKPGDLPYDMEKVINAMSEGTVSQVVESAYGYHIFRLDKRFQPQLRPEKEVAAVIRARLLEQKVQEAVEQHVAGLKETLSWESIPANLFFNYQGLEK
jgi:parvulin-like peptidyl-prolyl isomerase